MYINIKTIVIALLIATALPASAQVPPGAPTPKQAARDARDAANEAGNVVEAVQNVNDAIKAMKDVKRKIDSIVANDKSHTAGEVHLIFLGINFNDENLAPVETELKNMKGITDLKKLQKTATVTFEMKSDLVPYNIWKDLPKKVQKLFFVHDKDPYNVILLYRPPPQKKN